MAASTTETKPQKKKSAQDTAEAPVKKKKPASDKKEEAKPKKAGSKTGKGDDSPAVSNSRKGLPGFLSKLRLPHIPFPKLKYRITKRPSAASNAGVLFVPLALIVGIVLVLVSACVAAIFISRNLGPAPEERLEIANTYLAQKDYVDAAGVYADLIAEEKLLVPAYLGLANTLVERGSLEDAVELLQKGLETTGQDPFLQERLDELLPMLESPPEVTEKPQEQAAAPATPHTPQKPKTPKPTAPDIPIAWKDAELERLVRLALNIPAPTPVLQSDVVGLYSLKILGPSHAAANQPLISRITADGYTIEGVTYTERGRITSLEDLVYFKGLRRLIIGFQSLQDIGPLASLPSLETVGLYFNEIESLEPLSKLAELKYLYVYNNRIQELSPLSGCTQLKQLWVQNNRIVDVSPLQGLHGLTELYIGGNNISDISSLASLTSLLYLDADRNRISDISAVQNMPALQSVSFMDNPVSDYTPAQHVKRVNGVYR